MTLRIFPGWRGCCESLCSMHHSEWKGDATAMVERCFSQMRNRYPIVYGFPILRLLAPSHTRRKQDGMRFRLQRAAPFFPFLVVDIIQKFACARAPFLFFAPIRLFFFALYRTISFLSSRIFFFYSSIVYVCTLRPPTRDRYPYNMYSQRERERQLLLLNSARRPEVSETQLPYFLPRVLPVNAGEVSRLDWQRKTTHIA